MTTKRKALPARPAAKRKLTRQQIFDRVWDYFVVKKHPKSMDGQTDNCFYLGPEGTRCAIGIFLAKPEAKACSESGAIFEVRDLNPDIYNRHFRDEDLQFLAALQRCHDLAYGVFDGAFNDDIEWRLRLLMGAYNLAEPRPKKRKIKKK